MEMNLEGLQFACFEIAQVAMQTRMPVDISRIEDLCEQFYEIAQEKSLYLEGTDRDPSVLIRAIHYIQRTHAIFIGDNLQKFEICLETLLELACPTVAQTESSLKFLDDIEDGLTILRSTFSTYDDSGSRIMEDG